MTTYIEFVGVFVCGVLSGAAGAIQVAEMMGVLTTQLEVVKQEPAGSGDESTEPGDAEVGVRRPAKRMQRRTPWRKVRAQYEAEHRRMRRSVEERVQEMEGR